MSFLNPSQYSATARWTPILIKSTGNTFKLWGWFEPERKRTAHASRVVDDSRGGHPWRGPASLPIDLSYDPDTPKVLGRVDLRRYSFAMEKVQREERGQFDGAKQTAPFGKDSPTARRGVSVPTICLALNNNYVALCKIFL
jgi:hypothetical protein